MYKNINTLFPQILPENLNLDKSENVLYIYAEKKKLELKVKLFSNTIRKLKRKNQQLAAELPGSSDRSPECPFTVFIDAVSPAAKKRAKRKLKLSTDDQNVKKSLRLDKVIVELNERDGSCRNQDTKKRVKDFVLSDSNSICVPDTKVKAGTRYRLSFLELLHLSECDSVDDEISYPILLKLSLRTL